MRISFLRALISVKGINYIAGLGTVFVFIGIFCFRATFLNVKSKEGYDVPVKNSTKVMLLLSGVICFALGILLILKSLKII